jgi:hypothetical protein
MISTIDYKEDVWLTIPYDGIENINMCKPYDVTVSDIIRKMENIMFRIGKACTIFIALDNIESINIERLSNTITLMFESQNLKHQHKLTTENKEHGDYIIIKLYVEEHV